MGGVRYSLKLFGRGFSKKILESIDILGKPCSHCAMTHIIGITRKASWHTEIVTFISLTLFEYS